MFRRVLNIYIVFSNIFIAAAGAWEAPVWHGFVEIAAGARVSQDQMAKHRYVTLAEIRAQLSTTYFLEDGGFLEQWQSSFRLKGDATVDGYFDAKTGGELREAYVAMTPGQALDIKAGRQVLTWGTGDYLFINDVFPKDYVSFYIGRDDEYLKKPSDAIRISWYPRMVNVDVVIIPFFEPNTIPTGDRLSFFDSFQGGLAGRDSDRDLDEPGRQGKNIEYALRLYRNFGSAEAALYFFRGFDHMPRSYRNEAARQLYYERQDVYGGSIRAPFMGGIGNVEAGYVFSPEDSRGTDRLVENSSIKVLAGYEKDLGHDWKVSFQYYFEQKLDYAAYRGSLLPQDHIWDEYRHLLTQRLTKFFRNQTVMLSVFNFYSPSDHDGYARVSCAYDISDRWKMTIGANIPWGEDAHTDFGAMRKDKNVFIRLRYTF